ncbi:hypothetical protein G9A89_007684 [Geosiphon pyriformis]|nr:hypothetical protein G9A89_007684 [Geosiphon pyriformis]
MDKGFKETPYKDDLSVLKCFVKHLDNCADGWRSAQDYRYDAPYTVLFQGSGTGKSRILHQLAQHRFVLYLCFHENFSLGVPPTTKHIRDFFLKQKRNNMINIVAFFYSCIEFLDGKSIEDWNNQLRSDNFEYNTINNTISLVALHLSKTAKTKAKLIFAFDESQSLLGRLTVRKSTPFIQTRRALRCLSLGIFAIFADITSNLSDFVPLVSLDPPKVFAIFANTIPDLPGFGLKELFALGQSLWGAVLNSDAKIKELLELAEQKLLGRGITIDD